MSNLGFTFLPGLKMSSGSKRASVTLNSSSMGFVNSLLRNGVRMIPSLCSPQILPLYLMAVS